MFLSHSSPETLTWRHAVFNQHCKNEILNFELHRLLLNERYSELMKLTAGFLIKPLCFHSFIHEFKFDLSHASVKADAPTREPQQWKILVWWRKTEQVWQTHSYSEGRQVLIGLFWRTLPRQIGGIS